MSTAATRARAAARRAAARPVVDDGPRVALTGRAMVLGLVLVLLVFTLAVPARELFAQRAELNALRADAAATQLRVEELRREQQRLADPAYVQSLVRDRLHYVMPGETGYTVLGPDEAPAPEPARRASVDSAWYERLWESVEGADGDAAVAPDGEPQVPVRPDAPR